MTADIARRLCGQRILLVEDEFFIADEVAEAFMAHGAHVVGPEPTVAGALRLVATEPRLDAAVLDVNLRGEMVYPVADVLQAAAVPFVFTTGYDTSHIPARFATIPRCVKPFKPLDVAQRLFR